MASGWEGFDFAMWSERTFLTEKTINILRAEEVKLFYIKEFYVQYLTSRFEGQRPFTIYLCGDIDGQLFYNILCVCHTQRRLSSLPKASKELNGYPDKHSSLFRPAGAYLDPLSFINYYI